MRKINIIILTLALCLFLILTFANAAEESVTLQWEQTVADLPYIIGWEVQYSIDNQQTWTSFPVVSYVSQQDTYEADEMVLISDTGFMEVFFRARTLAGNDNHSDYCNAINKLFGQPTKVINFQFKVIN